MPTLTFKRAAKLEKAVLGAGVVAFIRELYAQRLERFQLTFQRIKAHGCHPNKDDANLANRLLAELRDPAAFERTLIALTALPYQSFEISTYGSRRYMVGKTREVIMDAYYGYHDGKEVPAYRYNIGPYFVAIREDIFDSGSIEQVHLIPAGEGFRSPVRTPHHNADPVEGKSPLAWEPHTCLGSFGTILLSVRNELDFPGVFRTWYLYLSRCNLNSQLYASSHETPIEQMTWKVKL